MSDRGEFSNDDPPNRRNDNEHPEQAYRRGYQQGAGAVLVGLRSIGTVDESVLEQVKEFVATIYFWRYGKNRLRRDTRRDEAPRMKTMDEER
jgi:hypothetical protein